MEKINWKQEYIDYMDFLNRDIEDMQECKTEEEYKNAYKEELENIIAINGVFYLYSNERKLAKLLNIDLN